MKFYKFLIVLLIPILLISCDDTGKGTITYLQELGLELIIEQPENNQELRPAIIFLHSGAWYLQDKSEMTYMLSSATENGYVAVSIEFRQTTKAPWPAQLKDARTSVRWLKTNAEKYMVDPNKIAIAGHSSGGHISLFTAFTRGMDEYDVYTMEEDGFDGIPYKNENSDVVAVCAWAPPTDLLALYLESNLELFVKESIEEVTAQLLYGPGSNEPMPLKTYEEEPAGSQHYYYYHKGTFNKGLWYEDYTDIAQKVSPFAYLYNNTVPILLIQGKGDIIVPHQTQGKMLSELEKNNSNYEYKLYGITCDHTFTVHRAQLKNDVMNFMNKHLK